MVYCGRCGRTGHYISGCKENYNLHGERISKLTQGEIEISNQNKLKAVTKRAGCRWTKEEEKDIEEDIEKYIKRKSKEIGRTENAIFIRMIKIMEDLVED